MLYFQDFLYNFKDYPRGLKYAANIIIYLSTGFHFFLWEISKVQMLKILNCFSHYVLSRNKIRVCRIGDTYSFF